MHSRTQKATYILVPNWTFVPGGPIALGNIIADPFRPHLVLSKAPPSPSPDVQRVPQKDWQFGLSQGHNVTTSLWASFADLVSLRLGGSTTRVQDENYSMRELETAYYSDLLGLSSHIKERVNKDSAVREVMRFDNPFSKPVWMISGIKIARGFTLSSGRERANGINLEAGGPAVVPVSVGAGVGLEVKRKKDLRFQSETDIVFAYQLLRIAPKGWKDKRIEMREHFIGAAFLSDKGPDQQDVEVEEDLVEVDDLEGMGRDFAQYGKTANEGEYVCVVAEADSDDDSDESSDDDD
ncbi:hypothetical protein TWF696_000447 [Orbilia brochopaga]|uniref:Uncharacterized protein n=1 Tax=Orbilia brochopaga TaxID=3140254 RepID=A0AAV9VBE2_9PEZI